MLGQCHVSNCETSWNQGTISRVNLKAHPRHPFSSQQLLAVSSAVRFIPAPHLQDMSQREGYIKFSIPGCTLASGSGHQRQHDLWIYLRRECLSERYDSAVKFTLSNEIGDGTDIPSTAMAYSRGSISVPSSCTTNLRLKLPS